MDKQFNYIVVTLLILWSQQCNSFATAILLLKEKYILLYLFQFVWNQYALFNIFSNKNCYSSWRTFETPINSNWVNWPRVWFPARFCNWKCTYTILIQDGSCRLQKQFPTMLFVCGNAICNLVTTMQFAVVLMVFLHYCMCVTNQQQSLRSSYLLMKNGFSLTF